MSNKKKNRYAEPGMYVTFELVKSKAFSVLTGKSVQILMDFLCKRKFDKDLMKHGNFSPVNKDRMMYTRKEATSRGYTERVFAHGINRLIEVGFLGLIEQGGGMEGHALIYALSQRWRKYGTPDFVRAERPKDTRAFKVASMAAAREKRKQCEKGRSPSKKAQAGGSGGVGGGPTAMAAPIPPGEGIGAASGGASIAGACANG